MPNCCIQNCNNSISDTTYYTFPFHNAQLLKKWLNQIGKLDWKPNENDYICAAHFCAEDIVDEPHKKYPKLKENAFPTIFPKQLKSTLKLRTQKSEISVVNNCTPLESGITIMPSSIQATPIVLTPTIVEPLTTIDSTLLPLSSTPQRFRKILPKLNQISNIMPFSIPEKNNVASNTLPNSYIIIIPTLDNTKSISAPSTLSKLPPPNKKKPILRLTVNRKYDIDPSLVQPKIINDDNQTKGDSMDRENSEDTESSSIEEVIIKHKTLNKFVVYSLDVLTGMISVSYRDSSPASGRNDKLHGTHMKLRENPRKRKIWEEPIELANMYKRVKKDCSKLWSRLQILRKKHKKEKDAIEALQKKLAAMETHQGTASETSDKLIDKSLTDVDNFELISHINQPKLSYNRKGMNDNQSLKVNKQVQSSNSNQNISINDKSTLVKSNEIKNQSFIWRLREENESCDFTEVDEATINNQTSKLKARGSYANINDASCVNY